MMKKFPVLFLATVYCVAVNNAVALPTWLGGSGSAEKVVFSQELPTNQEDARVAYEAGVLAGHQARKSCGTAMCPDKELLIHFEAAVNNTKAQREQLGIEDTATLSGDLFKKGFFDAARSHDWQLAALQQRVNALQTSEKTADTVSGDELVKAFAKYKGGDSARFVRQQFAFNRENLSKEKEEALAGFLTGAREVLVGTHLFDEFYATNRIEDYDAAAAMVAFHRQAAQGTSTSFEAGKRAGAEFVHSVLDRRGTANSLLSGRVDKAGAVAETLAAVQDSNTAIADLEKSLKALEGDLAKITAEQNEQDNGAYKAQLTRQRTDVEKELNEAKVALEKAEKAHEDARAAFGL